MTKSTEQRIPHHLRRYIVQQNYSRYTPEDQAVWRYIMRQLKNFLSQHAHASYVEGFRKSGLTIERIPVIDEIDEHLVKFGWGAVPVSGFIPPAAFMEFQSIGVLPIASDMRSLDHLLYTPAPDIVHEAAGHAPILADPEYAAYLRQYGEVARHSIISKEDMAQYEAIRVLSDAKEDPSSSPAEIKRLESELETINRNMKHVSEAALLSRMNWWTAEYGLVGTLQNPKIFGAGLLSSVGEAKECLSAKVKKIPLTVDCVNYSYDITEPQPQLFVCRDFAHLGLVLEDLTARLAYRRGGSFGIERAIEAETVNTVQLNSGVQISGVLTRFLQTERSEPYYLQFSGPCQLGAQYRELAGQGASRHPQGFSTPIGLLHNHQRCLSSYSEVELANLALKRGAAARLMFDSGVTLEGVLKDWLYHEGKLILMTWKTCKATFGDTLLYDPAWGEFDMAVGQSVTSVFGGPADRSRYGVTEDFVAKKIPPKNSNDETRARQRTFQRLQELRHKGTLGELREQIQLFLNDPKRNWLIGVELLELGFNLQLPEKERAELEKGLPSNDCVADGVLLAPLTL